MKKRITSIMLAAALTAGSIAAVPLSGAAETAFNPDEHLVKISDSSYQIKSLNDSVTMNLFENEEGAWSYSVTKDSLKENVEKILLGDMDGNGIIDVNDMSSVKSIILNGSNNEKQLLAANIDQKGGIDVNDMTSVKSYIMQGATPDTVDYITTTGEKSDWVKPSALGIKIDNTNYLSDAKIKSITLTETNRTYDHFGNQSKLTDNGINAEIEFWQDGETFYMDARIYDNGIAFRYRLPGEGNRTVNDELTTFNLRSDLDEVWYGVNNQDYEAVIEKHSPNTASNDHIVAPLTAVVSDGKGYISVQEGGMSSSYVGTNLIALGNAAYRVSNTQEGGATAKNFTASGDIITGWRLINLADTLDALVNNYNVYHVNEAPDETLYADTSWIEPGRSAWSWLTDYGATLGNSDAMYDFTLNASRLGFEYNVIDEGYTASGWGDYQNELGALGLHGDSLNVKQLLWAQVSTSGRGFKMTNVSQAKNYLDFLKSHNIYGGKIDFWWSEASTDRVNKNNTALQEEILKMAAERELIINFHGCNKLAGLDATYPNELSREAIRGLENIGASSNGNYTTQAAWLTAQLFTRYLSGHADWTPACNTAMQIASVMMIDSPLNVIATNPKDILANPAVEMIKSIPTVWDSTKVLSNSVIGDKAVYAKNTNGTWFLGGIYANETATDTIALNEFLDDGSYMMELWIDAPEGKTVTHKTVTANDVIELTNMSAGNGFIARFSKIALNQYGGEITKPVEITTADESSVVKYTTDGSDPLTSNTAKTYTTPVKLNETCEFRAAIADGEGKGCEVSATFNYITMPYLEHNIEYADGKSTVSFVHNSNAEVKYTTDGSDPLTSSTAKTYTGEFDVTEITPINAVAVTDGEEPVALSFSVYVLVKEIPTPDLYIGGEYVSGKTDWGEIHIDEGMSGSGSKLLLGGNTYDKGISCNAKATLVYNVPAGAERFVGIIGIDDRTFDSKDGIQASSTLTLSFDGKEAVTTPVFKRGDCYNVDVAVPEGAKQITIFFGDAGNGVTCDNVSFANVGWVMDKTVGNKISYDLSEKKGFSTLALSANFTGKIYYTTDGSEPTTSSELYTGTLTFTNGCTVKVLGVPENGGENAVLTVEVPVEKVDTAPDVFLSKDDLVGNPTSGWSGDPASIDKNTKGDTISIAGVEYLHGISTNAKGQFVFNIPANATKFVGVVGVDDCTYSNTNDGYKASITCSIYFDNSTTAAYESSVIKQGGFELIEIEVPDGATTIKIVFGDAGDGITCDNASLGNGGWKIG